LQVPVTLYELAGDALGESRSLGLAPPLPALGLTIGALSRGAAVAPVPLLLPLLPHAAATRAVAANAIAMMVLRI
jgi:hypothetical protein